MIFTTERTKRLEWNIQQRVVLTERARSLERTLNEIRGEIGALQKEFQDIATGAELPEVNDRAYCQLDDVPIEVRFAD